MELCDFAQKIYLIHKEEKLLTEPVLLDKIKSEAKIEMIDSTNIIEIQGHKNPSDSHPEGNEKVEKIILDKPYKDKTYLDVDGVFIEVGTEPGVQLARKLGVATDEHDYIKIKEDMSTNISGVFAAGDITTGSNKFRQVLTACAEGAIASNGAYKLLKLT
jgi:thioredoxin reductase (NADPH)